MPRIPAATDGRVPGPVISQPRPAEVRALPTMPMLRSPLIELGSSVSDAGNVVLAHLVQQERSAVATRLRSDAEGRLATLRSEVEQQGTVAAGRALWNEQSPRLKDELSRMATDAGLPEAAPNLELSFNLTKATVEHSLGRRAAGEGVDAARAYAATKADAYVNAASAVEAERHRTDLHRELQLVAETNPLLTPGDADVLFQGTIQSAAGRRAEAQLAGVADDPDGLRAMLAGLADENRFVDLPADRRAKLLASGNNLIERAEAKIERDRLAAGARTLATLQVGVIDASNPLQLDALRDQAEQLHATETITPAQFVTTIGAIEAQRDRLTKVDTTAQDALAALTSGTLKSQAQADDAFKAVVAATPERATMEPTEQLDFDLSFAAESGYLPNHVRLMIDNAEHSADPGELARGALIEQRTRELAPNARRDPGLRVLDTIALAEQAQIPLDQAALRVHENIPDKATRAERDEQFGEAFPDLDARDWLFDQGLSSVHRPLLPDAAATVDAADARQAEQALQLAFRETGDPARAQEVATRWLQRRGYGVSSLGGGEPRFMRYAPELMTPPGVPPAAEDAFTGDLFGSIIDADVRRALAAAGVEIAPAEVEGVPDYALRPIEGVTERQIRAGERPEYEVLIRDEDGILTPALVTLDDGSTAFMRYRLHTLAEVQASDVWQGLIRGEMPAPTEPASERGLFAVPGGS
jgi:hypothetical protein